MKTVMGTRAFLFATLLGVYSGTVSAGLINSKSVSSPTVAPTYNPNLYVPEPPLMVLMGGGLSCLACAA